jgi:hypothetical protein
VVKSASVTSRTSGFALGLLVVTAVIQLFVVAVASVGFDEVAGASPFGRPGTAIAAGVIAVVTLVGAVVAWRGGVGVVRVITAMVVFISVGMIAMMAMSFVVAGGTTLAFAILLILAAVSLGMIGRAVLQSPSGSGR